MTFVSRPTVTRYAGPDHPHFITERDVRAALDFLVAVEPAKAASMAEYEAALAPRRDEVEIAMGTLRGFAEQTDPLTLEALRGPAHQIFGAAAFSWAWIPAVTCFPDQPP